MEVLRHIWEKWQSHPNSDYEHYKIVCKLRQEFVTPYVLIVELEEKIACIFIARLERALFSPSIGYLKAIRIPIKSLTVLYQGLLGSPNEDICRQLVEFVKSFLKAGHADIVTFHNLPEHSPLMKDLKLKKVDCSGRSGWSKKRVTWSTHWAVTLGEKPGSLLKKMNSKHRSWIRSRKKKLESSYPGKVSWQWVSKFENIEEIAARLELVAARTYQRGLGGGFVNDEEHRHRYELFARRGQLRMQLVEIEGTVKAFWVGMVYKGVFFSSATGYDPDFRAFELGTLMLITMADELEKEGVFKIDFGLGDAFYKERFGDEKWLETTVHMFAPNLKGVILHTIEGVSVCIDSLLRSLLQKVGILNRVKTTVRRLVQRRPS